MATKNELELARDAGRAAMHTEPADRKHVGACPFPAGTPEREAWLEGFEKALDEHPDPAELRRTIKEARA